MTTVTITRIAYTPQGVFGILEVNNFICFTLERPYLDNKINISCIPCGEYDIKKGTFESGGGYPNYEIVYVEGRTNIEIHAGNKMYDSKGCILLGTMLGEVKHGDQKMLGIAPSKSIIAVEGFVRAMGNQENAKLIIENAMQPLIFGEETKYA